MTNTTEFKWIDMGEVEPGQELRAVMHKGRFTIYNPNKSGEVISAGKFLWLSDCR